MKIQHRRHLILYKDATKRFASGDAVVEQKVIDAEVQLVVVLAQLTA